MVKKNACIFISGQGSNLKNLIQRSRDNNFPINIKLVISNNKPCTSFFDKGAIFVSNDPNNIANGIKIANKNKLSLSREMKILKNEKNDMWKYKIRDLKRKIDVL